MASPLGVPAQSAFKEEKQSVYYTLVHLNDLGYKLVAERIYKNLLANQ